MQPTDIVVPAHPKDFGVLRHALSGVLRHVPGVERVFVVGPERPPFRDARVRWLDEGRLAGAPTLADVRAALARLHGVHAATSRGPWLYQQLLKLASGSAIDGLSERYLVMDADVIFLRDTDLVATVGNRRFPYSLATERHAPYLDACRRLLGATAGPQSFVAHHMVFDREFVRVMLDEISDRCEGLWWEAILAAADPAEPSSFSEWNLYGHWVLLRP